MARCELKNKRRRNEDVNLRAFLAQQATATRAFQLHRRAVPKDSKKKSPVTISVQPLDNTKLNSSPSCELSSVWVVYKATSPLGKVYIGITKRSLNRRQIEHCALAGKGSNRHFMNALRKYGDQMQWEVIHKDIGSLSQAETLECAYIAKFKSSDRRFGYNLTEGGGGVIASVETRAKMSRSAKARGVSAKQLANLDKGRGECWVGRKHSVASKGKMSSAKTGLRISGEWRQKMSEAHQGRVFSDEHKRKIKEANLRLPDSERRPKGVTRSDGAVYDSMAAAARASSLSVSQIRTALKTGRPTQQGFTFTKVTPEFQLNS